LLVQADRLGYHEAWIGEHITEMWENAPVPEFLIAQALASWLPSGGISP